MATILILIAAALILYFGYKDDYQRDKKGFLITILGVLSLIIGLFLINKYDSLWGGITGGILLALSQYLKKVFHSKAKKESEN